MDAEEIELINRDVPNDDVADLAETNFGGIDITANDPLIPSQPKVEGIAVNEDRMKQITRRFKHRDMKDFFTGILELEPSCSDTSFMDYLIDNDVISIIREPSRSGLNDDYHVSYLGYKFSSIGRVLTNEESDVLRTGIRRHYDEWNSKLYRKTAVRAGVLAGIGLGIISIVTGLAVGLTRGGSDVIHAGKKRREWEKLNPSKVTIPWSDIEEAGGGALVFTGEYLTVILAISVVYLIVRR